MRKRRGVFNATRQRKVKGFKVKNRSKKTRRATMEYDKQRRAREKEKRRLRKSQESAKKLLQMMDMNYFKVHYRHLKTILKTTKTRRKI